MDHIATMIIDDGVKSRVHRQNFFNEKYYHMSCFEATHKLFKRVMVFVYAQSYVELVDEAKNSRISIEVQNFIKEPVLFNEELLGLGLELPESVKNSQIQGSLQESQLGSKNQDGSFMGSKKSKT